MQDIEAYIKRVRDSIDEDVMPIHEVVVLRREDAAAKVPTAMDILFTLPDPDEPEFDETHIFTAGMSTHVLNGPIPRMEIGMIVKGSPDAQTRTKWAHALGEFAVRPFRDGQFYSTPMTIPGTTITPFDGFDAIWLVGWEFAEAYILPDLVPEVRLIQAIPLFQAEVDEAQTMSLPRFLGLMQGRKINFADPNRKPMQS